MNTAFKTDETHGLVLWLMGVLYPGFLTVSQHAVSSLWKNWALWDITDGGGWIMPWLCGLR